MSSFLKDIQNRSKSFRSEKSRSANNATKANGRPQNGNVSAPPKLLYNNHSTSTLNSAYGGTSTPPSTVPSEDSSFNLKLNSNGSGVPIVPSRPQIPSKRYSINVSDRHLPSHGSFTLPFESVRSPTTTSPFAPRVTSITSNSWVNQKILLVSGHIGDPPSRPLDGTVVVNHHNDSTAPTSWQVCESQFKSLVYLQPGPNRLRFDFYSPKIPQSNTSTPVHSSFININYLPLTSSPPLQLAIIVGKDSPFTYDAVPERVAKEGNGIYTAVRKYKMAAYLWQAFTGEQMNRNGFGRRCFRFEEEWQQGSLSGQDWKSHIMRSEAKVHVIRSGKTVAEIRDLDIAQQYDGAKNKGDLYGIAADAIRAYFSIPNGQTQYVAAMFLDSHWDKEVQTIRGHAALGGSVGNLQLAIFGSHALQSYPACLEEVGTAFSDCTKTDTNYVANDCNEAGSNWESANVGIGAHMHEVGHLFGCPHQETGVMLREYTKLNRTFTCREPYSTRTNSRGQICSQQDECGWHRLDCLRFRFHPCFRHESDQPLREDGSIQVWSGDSIVMVTASTGITFIEIYTEGDDVCKHWIDYVGPRIDGASRDGLPRQLSLTEADLRNLLPEYLRKRKLKLAMYSAGQCKHIIEDFSVLLNPKTSRIKLWDGRYGYRGGKLGYSQMEGSEPHEVILDSAMVQTKLMTAIRVYSGFAVDGIEFFYEDGASQLFGKRGGKLGGSDFLLDTRKGELLLGFYMRTGLWIDAIQILTSLGRKSEVFGRPDGGSGQLLIPPRSYNIVGISGSCGQWLDGFQVIIAR
ncbi:putative zinc metallo proteinase [Pseudovirgaria hyperparasitica]|uniref:Putative zinc metallo proteinase n=1 Tax=Pseudovirgaria hyperparasitica TaxID=470096 RepID=A0A6A6W5Y2_9PEZI|nr:putative zinc metallo proteinase [Pseudovirgaria hyperparasitica]KAF2758292.1 putative zinc metallo proteinase [Pseudovirgaria hyperparasitica]